MMEVLRSVAGVEFPAFLGTMSPEAAAGSPKSTESEGNGTTSSLLPVDVNVADSDGALRKSQDVR